MPGINLIKICPELFHSVDSRRPQYEYEKIGDAELNVEEALRSTRCWERYIQDDNDAIDRPKKKILLSGISLYCFDNSELRERIQWMISLMSAGFELYVLNEAGKRVQVDPSKMAEPLYLKNLLTQSQCYTNPIQEGDPDPCRALLEENHENPDDYAVLDHYEMKKLLYRMSAAPENESEFKYTLRIKSNDQSLNFPPSFTTYDLQKLPSNIEELDLKNCEEIEELLDLSKYKSLKKLILPKPTDKINFENLPPNLEELHIDSGELPNLSKCRFIKKLTIPHIKANELQKLPPYLEELNLISGATHENLDLKDYNFLKNLTCSCNVVKLPPNLEFLSYTGDEPINFSKYASLKELHLTTIKPFVKLPPKLEKLNIQFNTHYKPIVPNYPDLKELTFSHNHIKTIDTDHLPRTLETFTIYSSSVDTQPDFSAFKSLKILNLRCPIGTIDPKHLPSELEQLSIGLAKGMSLGKSTTGSTHGNPTNAQPDFSAFNSLKVLELHHLIKTIDFTKLPPRLEVLKIYDSSTTVLPNFSTCISLKALHLSCPVTAINPEKLPSELEKLDLSSTSIEALPDLSKCTSLKELILPHSVSGKIDPKKLPPGLEVLDLRQCKQVSLPTNFYKYVSKKLVLPKDSLDIFKMNPAYEFPPELKELEDILSRENSSFQSPHKPEYPLNPNTYAPKGTPISTHYHIYQTGNLNKAVDPSNHREHISDGFKLKDSNPVPYKNENAPIEYIGEEELGIRKVPFFPKEELETPAKDTFFCQFPISTPKKWIPLPGLSSFDRITKINCPPDVKLRYNKYTQQYEIYCPTYTPELSVQYLFTCEEKPPFGVQILDMPDLPDDLKQQIKDLFQNPPPEPRDPEFEPLQENFNKIINLGAKEKSEFCLGPLKHYIGINEKGVPHFKNEALTPVPDLPLFAQILTQAKGSCSHRALLYTLLCQYLGVKARHIRGPVHCYAEVWNEKKWQAIDLGGAEGEMHSTAKPIQFAEPSQTALEIKTGTNAAPHRDVNKPGAEAKTATEPPTNPTLSIQPAISETKTEIKSTGVSPELAEPPIPSPSELTQYYTPQAEQKEYETEDDVLRDLSRQKNVFMKVGSLENGRTIHAALSKQLKGENPAHPIVYLECMDDIHQQWTYSKILPNGQREEIDGSLKTLIRSGGTLVINWGRFNPTEMASCMELMEKSFRGVAVSPELKLIHLIPPNAVAGNRFYSRTHEFIWPPHIPKLKPYNPLSTFVSASKNKATVEEKKPAEEKKSEEDNKKDLYGNPLTHRPLLQGEILLDEHQFKFVEGALKKAIDSKKNYLELTDAPWQDPSFSEWIHRLSVERACVSNGDVIPLDKDFSIQKGPTVAEMKPPGNSAFPSSPPTDTFYLNRHTLRLLFRRQYIKDGLMKTSCIEEGSTQIPSGWLNQKPITGSYKTLVLTQPLSPGEKRQVYQALSSGKYPYVKWVDLTQPVSTTLPHPPSEEKAEPAQKKEEGQKCCAELIETPDPAFKAFTLKQDNPEILVLPLGTHTRSNEYVEKTTLNRGLIDPTDCSNWRFEHIRLALTKALVEEGRTVILSGQLSEEFYYTVLEPLFSPNPTLRLSDSEDPVPLHPKAKLVIVSHPLTFKPHLAEHWKQPSPNPKISWWKEYGQQLIKDYPQQKPKDLISKLQKIAEFYYFANRIPHGQSGTPLKPRISYIRIKRFIEALNDPENDNPIKSFFHHDYQHDTETYARLNAFAKFHFSTDKGKPPIPDEFKASEQKSTERPSESKAFEQKSSGATEQDRQSSTTLPKKNSRAHKLEWMKPKMSSIKGDEYIRFTKLSKYPAGDPAYFWRRLNCLNAAALKTCPIDYSKPVTENMEKFETWLSQNSNEIKAQEQITPKLDPQTKTATQLKKILKTHRTVVLKGPSGSGKTFAAFQYRDAVKSGKFFGEKDITKWLTTTPTPGTEAVLILDEANLSQPGVWEFLVPLLQAPLRDNVNVFWDQQARPVSPQHKIIFTGNPEHYPARFYHALLQDSPTLYVKSWTPESLKKYIIQPLLLENSTLSTNFLMDQFVQVYQEANNLLHPTDTLSVRDLQQVIMRWKYHSLNEEVTTAARKACEFEWGHRFPTSKKQTAFKEILENILTTIRIDQDVLTKSNTKELKDSTSTDPQESKAVPLKPMTSTGWSAITSSLNSREIKKSPIKEKEMLPELETDVQKIIEKMPAEYYLTEKHLLWIRILHEDMCMAERYASLKNPLDDTPIVKHGVLLEGHSGIGKTTLFLKFLEASGYQLLSTEALLNNADPPNTTNGEQKYYLQFTPSGDPKRDEQILRQAFHRGYKVVLDELNLDPLLENLLNQLLTGKTPEGEPPTKPGFFVLASQNDAKTQAGSKRSSIALKNRFHVMHPILTEVDLKKTATKAIRPLYKNPSEGMIEALSQAHVSAYYMMQKAHPDKVNLRRFFEGLKEYCDKIQHPTNIPQKNPPLSRESSAPHAWGKGDDWFSERSKGKPVAADLSKQGTPRPRDPPEEESKCVVS